MSEHPQNLRPARHAEPTWNSRRHASEASREDGRSWARTYQGSHRADDEYGTDDHTSRMGRHHEHGGGRPDRGRAAQ